MPTKPTFTEIIIYGTLVILVLIVVALTILGASALTIRPVYQNF